MLTINKLKSFSRVRNKRNFFSFDSGENFFFHFITFNEYKHFLNTKQLKANFEKSCEAK